MRTRMPFRNRFMATVAIVLGVLASFPFSADAETRRALLIGIDTYQPAEAAAPDAAAKAPAVVATLSSGPSKARAGCVNLDGAVNDAAAMREVLIAKYGFKPENILVLTNGEATRERILSSIQKQLIDPSTAGDTAVFFYAGHGSQVINSKSRKPDHRDETIVPADSTRGAPDIRDRELARLFNMALDKGVVLSAIFDSCHSGSVARGYLSLGKARSCTLDTRDIADPSEPITPPEERGALILSSAQDYQVAKEVPGGEHGAFSFALFNALQSASADQPAEQVFLQVKAMMQTEGSLQEPVLAGPPDRRARPLFGGGPAASAGRTVVAVLRIEDNGVVQLQGGPVVGINRDCELRKVGGAQVRLRVIEVKGLSLSRAKVIQGKAGAIGPGDLFEVDRWAAPAEAVLRVWMPPAPADREWDRVVREASALRGSDRVQWIDDPTKETPTHVLSWERSGWRLQELSGEPVIDLGKSLSASSVLEKIAANGKERPKLFLNVPPSGEMSTALRALGGPVEIASSVKAASYLLVGRLRDQQREYAWVLPGATDEDARNAGLQLPVRTDWIAVESTKDSSRAGAATLKDLALRIATVKGWLQIAPPPDKGYFPYRLALKNDRTGEVSTGGTVREGETYSLLLQADASALRRYVDRRFVYAFVIDANGESRLLFPKKEAGTVGNRVPYDVYGQDGYAAEIRLGQPGLLATRPPFGVSTIVLIASEEAIPLPRILELRGVRTAEEERPVRGYGGTEGGADRPAETNWSIQRIKMTSMYGPR